MRRATLFLLVVVMHVLAIGCLDRMMKRGDSSLGRSADMVQVVVERDEEYRGAQLDVPFSYELPSVFRPKLNYIPETLLSPNSSANESVDAPIDWRAEGEKAAKDAVRSANERKPMIKPPSAAPADVPKSSVFGSILENQRAGKIEMFEDVERVFVTDNCYYDFEFARGSGNPKSAVLGVPRLKCAPPPTGGGANMFKDLTPKYLDPEKRDGTTGR